MPSIAEPRYRALRILLGFLSLLMAIGGIVLVFSSKGMAVRVFLHPPESEVSTLLLVAVKEMGGLLLMLSTMLFLAARDPVRNVAIVHAVVIGLSIFAVTPIISLYNNRRAPSLSGLFDLGTIRGAPGAGGCGLVAAAAGGALENRGQPLKRSNARA